MKELKQEFILDFLKKNNCSFDFVAVMPPENMDQVRREFENFFGGFEYQ